MQKILIGSAAIRHWFPDFPRDPKDIDYIVKDPSQFEKVRGIEYLPNPVLDHLQNPNVEVTVLEPNLILTLKMSHLFWDINWNKHMFDVQFLLEKGCEMDLDIFNKLVEYWNVYHKKNHRSDLKMSKLDFFNNALKLEYEHDEVHTLLKSIPTYTHILIGEVEVSEEKFNLLTFEQKCDLAAEEIMVMAWERWPKEFYKVAYWRMAKKFLISHAPIWEAIFMIKNWKALRDPKFNFIEKINSQLHTLKKK